MLAKAWPRVRLNCIRAWVYFHLAWLLSLSSLSAFRRLMPHVESLPENEKREVFGMAFAGFVSSIMLHSIAIRRREQGSLLPVGLLKLWLMFDAKGRKEWEYQIERFALAWMKADARDKIRAKREEREKVK